MSHSPELGSELSLHGVVSLSNWVKGNFSSISVSGLVKTGPKLWTTIFRVAPLVLHTIVGTEEGEDKEEEAGEGGGEEEEEQEEGSEDKPEEVKERLLGLVKEEKIMKGEEANREEGTLEEEEEEAEVVIIYTGLSLVISWIWL